MKVKDIIGQLEHTYGRKSHKYLMSLINDGLDEIAQTGKANVVSATTGLEKNQRWYLLDNKNMIDVTRVEVLDDKGDWRQIPRLASEPEIGDRD
jgi:DUF1365 family protein